MSTVAQTAPPGTAHSAGVVVGPSIPSRFRHVAREHAQRPAVVTVTSQWTYAELDARSDSIAIHILAKFDDRSEAVLLLMNHDAPLIAAILGTLKAGMIYLALDPSHPAERLAVMSDDSQARLVLTDSDNLALAKRIAPAGARLVDITDPLTEPGACPNLPEISPDSGAWLKYTSGSTGRPKGVWQNHRGLIQQTEVYSELIGLTPDDRLSLLTSCSLAASSSHLFGALLNGAALYPFHVRSQGMERLARWLSQSRVNVYHSVPTIFRQLANLPTDRSPFDGLRLVRLGGEPLFRSDVENFRQRCPDHCRLMHAFSSTETGLISAHLMDKQTPLPSWRVPVGHPVRGVKVLLLDEQGRPVPSGGEGRIAVRSPHLRQGYWRQPEATAVSFLGDAEGDQPRTFISHDLGRILPDGCLEHLGRGDNVVKLRGQRVDLSDVEAALQATGLSEEVAVIARDQSGKDQRLVAYFVPRSGAAVSSHSWRQKLESSLPQYMIPTTFVGLARLPQTVSGKIDRRALATAPISPTEQSGRPFAKPRDGIEQKLARIWKSVLNHQEVGRSDDFFDLGGTSLQLTELLVRIEERFDIALSASAVVENSTLEKLAALVADRAVISAGSPLVTIRSGGSGRPVFLVHNGHGEVATYAQLARRLPDRPIYGLQAPGLQGERWPLMSVRGMARHYLPEILKADPTGPYLLAGTCMGGLVAFEIACQLFQQGRPVGLVALIDCAAPPYGGSRPPFNEMWVDPVREAFRMIRWALLRLMGKGRTGKSLPSYRHFIGSMTSQARHYYRPGFYPRTITLITTRETRFKYQDRRLLMSRYARETNHIVVSGDRQSLFQPPAVDELGAKLQYCLDTHGASRQL